MGFGHEEMHMRGGYWLARMRALVVVGKGAFK